MTRAQKATFAAVAGFLMLMPLPTTVTSSFTLEAIQRFEVRPPAPGVVREVMVNTGERVSEGQALARLASPALEEAQTRDRALLAQVQEQLAAAENAGDQTGIGQALEQARQIEADLADVERKLSGLEMRTAIAGVVTTPEVSQKTGLYLHPGDTFAEVADQRELKARLLVIDRDLQYVRVGSKVALKLRAFPLRALTGHVTQIMPAAAQDRPLGERERPKRLGQDLMNYFVVVVELPNPGGELRPGMTGEGKIYAAARPMAWQFSRKVWRWARSQVW